MLQDSLNGSEWEGARSLQAVYGFVHQRLVSCNVTKDRSLLPHCVQLLEQIFEANTKAAAELTGSAPADAGAMAHAL